MKKVLLPLALLLAFMIAGCAKDPIVGTWSGDAPGPGGGKAKVSMSFKPDKTFQASMAAGGRSVEFSGVYELKEKTLTLTALKGGGKDIPKQLQRPETATLTDDGHFTTQGVTFTKQ